MRVKKITAMLLAGVLMTSTLTGCGVNKDATVATMKEQNVKMGLVNFMCRYQQAKSDDSYRSYFGENVWSQDLMGNGTTMADSVKENVLEQIHEYYTAQAHMDEYGVFLSDDEKEKISETATAFINANTRSALKEMGATQAIVEEMLTLATIQDKVKDAIYAKADTNVSDEEANMRAYTMVEMSKEGKYDENNNYVEYTEEEQADVKENATNVFDSVKNGTELETAAAGFGFSAKTGTYDADDSSLEEDVKNALDGLKKGNTSELIETEKAFYIVRLDEETDKEATEKNRESIIQERKRTLYDETLEKWQEDDGWKVKENKMKAIEFKNFFTQNDGSSDNSVEEIPSTDTTESAE